MYIQHRNRNILRRNHKTTLSLFFQRLPETDDDFWAAVNEPSNELTQASWLEDVSRLETNLPSSTDDDYRNNQSTSNSSSNGDNTSSNYSSNTAKNVRNPLSFSWGRNKRMGSSSVTLRETPPRLVPSVVKIHCIN